MNLAATLRSVVGDDNVVEAADELAGLSGDLLEAAPDAATLAVAPGTVEELRRAVAEVYASGRPLVARGAAWSYTRAHVPAALDTVVFDMRRLDRVVEVNADDLHATVEAGCTWRALLDATAKYGVRTPFWGPLSGHRATIGGTLAQDALFYGSAAHGTAADSVLGLDVVRPDGTVLATGARSRPDAPFSTAFGPDLTRIFVGAAGTLGITARATFALLPLPPVGVPLSFATSRIGDAIGGLAAIGRSGLAAELVAFDEAHHALLGIDAPASFHAIVEAGDERLAAAAVAVVRELALRHGREVEPAVPAAIRADPFGVARTIFSPVREELLPPVNAILPHSRVEAGLAAVESFRPAVEASGCELWLFATAVGRNVVVIEPSIRVPAGADRARAIELRAALGGLLDPLGAAHVQLGKFYAYGPRLEPGALDAVSALKSLLDPDGLFNPGALGL